MPAPPIRRYRPMRLFLAPMEGLLDAALRDLLTAVGGFDACVTEFVRVSEALLPPRVFLRHCPELGQGGRTSVGVPVFLQLLGSHPALMAENAALAAELGAPGIDLNFGCPSNTVNRRDGGAVLLKDPERVRAIVAAVRAAVPAATPVTVKLRLGFADAALAVENGRAAADGGAALLTVHARTRADGYRAPARWEYLDRIRQAVNVPVVANGDISSPQSYLECRRISGCTDAMLGRGAVARPDLARHIRAQQDGKPYQPMSWPEVAALVHQLHTRMRLHNEPHKVMPRLKQWLAMLAGVYPQASELFAMSRTDRDPQRLAERLAAA